MLVQLFCALGNCLCHWLTNGQRCRIRHEHGATRVVVFGALHVRYYVLLGVATQRTEGTLGWTTNSEHCG